MNETPKPWIIKVDELSKSFFSLLLKVLMMIFGIVLFVRLVIDARTSKYRLENFNIPKELVDAGFTKELLSRNVLNKVKEIQNDTYKDNSDDDINDRVLIIGEINDYTISTSFSGISFSFGDLVRVVNDFLINNQEYIEGDLIFTNEEIRLYLSSSIDFNQTLSDSSNSISLRMDTLTMQAALYVLTVTDPKTVAYHYYVNDLNNKAIEAIDLIEEESKDAKWGFNLAGLIYKKEKQYQKSIESLKKALLLDDDFISAYNNLGITYYRNGEYQLSVATLKKAIFKDKKNKYKYSRYSLGKTYTKMKMYDSAILAYKEAIKIDSAYMLARNNLAFVYTLIGECNHSKNILDEAFDLAKRREDRALLWSTMAEAMYCTGNIDSFYLAVDSSRMLDKSVINNFKEDKPYSFFKEDAEFKAQCKYQGGLKIFC